MKIALISSLVGELGSLSIQRLSSYLTQNGHETVLFFVVENPNEKSIGELVAIINKLGIDMIGINVFTHDLTNIKKITKAIKMGTPKPVLWGGPHPTINPKQSLRYTDLICMGEGEEALLELMNKMEKGQDIKNIKNICFMDKKNELRDLEENLDKYPFPDYDFEKHYALLKNSCRKITKKIVKKYWDGVYYIMTSRGCPYSCAFCYNNYRKKIYQNKGKYVRFRSPENVIAELKCVKKKFPKLRLVKFWDDLLLAHPQIKRLAELYEKEIGIKFDCMSTPIFITKEKILLLKKANMSSIHIGIQTGSEEINKNIYCRDVPNELLIEKAKLLKSLDITVRYDIIFNNPYETKADLLKTIDLLLKLPKPFQVQGYSLVFFPKTKIYDMVLKDRLITLSDKEWMTDMGENNVFEYIHQENKGNVLYSINFSSKEKENLNKIIMLTPFFSKKRIKYLVEHENAITRQFVNTLYYKNYMARLALSYFLSRHKFVQRIAKTILRKK